MMMRKAALLGLALACYMQPAAGAKDAAKENDTKDGDAADAAVLAFDTSVLSKLDGFSKKVAKALLAKVNEHLNGEKAGETKTDGEKKDEKNDEQNDVKKEGWSLEQTNKVLEELKLKKEDAAKAAESLMENFGFMTKEETIAILEKCLQQVINQEGFSHAGDLLEPWDPTNPKVHKAIEEIVFSIMDNAVKKKTPTVEYLQDILDSVSLSVRRLSVKDADTNGDGRIDTGEWKEFRKGLCGSVVIPRPPTLAREPSCTGPTSTDMTCKVLATALFNILDEKKNGKADFEEWSAFDILFDKIKMEEEYGFAKQAKLDMKALKEHIEGLDLSSGFPTWAIVLIVISIVAVFGLAAFCYFKSGKEEEPERANDIENPQPRVLENAPAIL